MEVQRCSRIVHTVSDKRRKIGETCSGGLEESEDNDGNRVRVCCENESRGKSLEETSQSLENCIL